MSEENTVCEGCLEIIPTKYFKTHQLNCRGYPEDKDAITPVFIDNVEVDQNSLKKFKEDVKNE